MTDVVCWLLLLFTLLLLLYVIFSWVSRLPEPLQPISRIVRAIVEPIAAPLRRLIPPVRVGGAALDISILVLFLLVAIVRSAICGGGGFF